MKKLPLGLIHNIVGEGRIRGLPRLFRPRAAIFSSQDLRIHPKKIAPLGRKIRGNPCTPFSGRALRGKTIAVTRSAATSKNWKTYFEQQGAVVYCFPTIETIPKKLTPDIANALSHIADFDWIIFTSAEGVRATRSLVEKSKPGTAPAHMPKIAVIGKGTAAAARKMRYRVAFQPSIANGETLAREIEPTNGKKILLLRAVAAPRTLPNILRKRGSDVSEIATYRTILLHEPDLIFFNMLKAGDVDFLTFASPSSVSGFLRRARGIPKKYFKKIPTVAIGTRVERALKKSGFNDIRVSDEPSAKGIRDAIIKFR